MTSPRPDLLSLSKGAEAGEGVSQEGRSLELAVLPSGRLRLEWRSSPINSPPPQAATRIAKSFEDGAGAGLLRLGAAELATPLSPSLAFGRELGHLFMTRFCAEPDLAARWETVEPPAPTAELERLCLALPPLAGAEYLDVERLETLWRELMPAARAAVARAGGDVGRWLAAQHPSWSLVGRICFHLAENKASEATPFAFLATYAARLSQHARVQHLPLGRALAEHAGDRRALLALLTPVSKAAEQSPWVKALADSGQIFRPLAWTPHEAYQLLRNVPQIEAAGILVRIPDWWKPQQPPRPQVQVRVGDKAAGLGLSALLDFSVELILDGETLSQQDLVELAAGSGLVRLKGKWVEVDREKLDAVLAHWRRLERGAAGTGLSFVEGMRLLAGAGALAGRDAEPLGAVAEWSRIVSGDWLRRVLGDLQSSPEAADPRPELKAELRPYQVEGVRWLLWIYRLGLGGCLADDMGLGKTIQVLALLLILKRAGTERPHLLVAPTTLLANWQAEAARFAPGLRLMVAHPSAMPAEELATLDAKRLGGYDLVITSYGMVSRLPGLAAAGFSLVVLDEAQAIKNPAARQTRAAKAIAGRVRLALTGTPVENRLGDLWSIFDFACPGLLGSAAEFSRFAKRLTEDGQSGGYAALRKLVRPYLLRRLKSDKAVIADLPDKTEMKAWCPLTRTQASLYLEGVRDLEERLGELSGIERRGLILAFLMRCKQICNHPSQWLGDGEFDPAASGKFARLAELAEEIAARQEKLLVFTQFREMTQPLVDFLGRSFGRSGLVLHGSTPARERKALVDAFQNEAGPPFFVLSLKAGGSGLNLTAASHVVHFDRWWNPAVENQATDRAYRIGQKRNVLVHKLICRGTVEEKIDALIEDKLRLSGEIVAGGGDVLLTEMSDAALLELVSLDLRRAVPEG